MKCKLKK